MSVSDKGFFLKSRTIIIKAIMVVVSPITISSGIRVLFSSEIVIPAELEVSIEAP